jgi:hypothetical protein
MLPLKMHQLTAYKYEFALKPYLRTLLSGLADFFSVHLTLAVKIKGQV